MEEQAPAPSPAVGFRLFLQSELARRCLSNPQYSLRSFALQLGINHSTLSQLLRGKRALTPRMIEALGGRLKLKPEEIEAFMERERRTGATVLSNEIRLLTVDTLALLSDGSHRAILELTHMKGFIADSRWIARTLDLTTDEVNMALSRLTRLGLLEMAEPDRWVDRSGADASGIDSAGGGFAQQVIRRLSERVRQLSQQSGAETQEKEDQQNEILIPAAARIEIGAGQLPAIMEFIEQLRRGAAESPRDEKEYQIEMRLSPTIAFKKKIFRSDGFKPPVLTPLADCTKLEFLVAHW
jgi:uncharacterized protein (TIGR02147 family)